MLSARGCIGAMGSRKRGLPKSPARPDRRLGAGGNTGVDAFKKTLKNRRGDCDRNFRVSRRETH